MEPVGLRSGSKIEIFDFAGHTIIADFSPVRNSHTPASADGASFRGKVAPFSTVRIGLIYRKIEGGGSEGRFEPVLVTHPTSTGRSAKQYRSLLSTSTGSFFFLYRLRCAVGVVGYSVSVGVAIFARSGMAGGGARLLCFTPL